MKQLSEKQVMAKLKALGSVTEEQRNDIVCALIGHSAIQSTWFAYFYCGRCEAQVGDQLGGAYDAKKVVIIGHNCETCRENYAATDWRDRLFVGDPFAEETTEA